MILPVFLSPIQENEKTALVKVSRGQIGPWRVMLSATLEEDEADGGQPHTQACLVLDPLLDPSTPIPEYQGDRGPRMGSSISHSL